MKPKVAKLYSAPLHCKPNFVVLGQLHYLLNHFATLRQFFARFPMVMMMTKIWMDIMMIVTKKMIMMMRMIVAMTMKMMMKMRMMVMRMITILWHCSAAQAQAGNPVEKNDVGPHPQPGCRNLYLFLICEWIFDIDIWQNIWPHCQPGCTVCVCLPCLRIDIWQNWHSYWKG